MSTTLILGMLAASLAGAGGDHAHRTTIEHRGVPTPVAYRASTAIETRQIGMAPPTRAGTVRCTWTAQVSVERQIGQNGAAGRVIDNGLTFKGSRPGHCTAARPAIEREVAARDADIRRHVAAVAERDRATLLAELEAAGHAGSGAH